MKIQFFLINMNLGGTEKSFLNLMNELPKDVEIDLLLLEKKGALLSEIPGNVNVRIIKNADLINQYISLGPRKFALKQLFKGHLLLFIKGMIQFFFDKLNIGFSPYWAIKKYIIPVQKSYDISIAYAGPHDFISYYVLKSVIARKKIQWIHFDVSKVLSDSKFGNKFYPLFDKIICVSDNAKREFIQMFPQLKANTTVFENIVSESLLKEQATQGSSFTDDFHGVRIVTLGRLSKEKGQQMIPEVVRKLKTDGFEFRWYLIGDGNLREDLEKEIKNNHLERDLILLGSQINPYAFLRDADIYVQTSLHEGYCITLKEAKIFNLPVVTTNFLSATNLIKDEEDGLIVDISVEGIYMGVKMMLENKELRDKLSVYNDDNLQQSNTIFK